MAPVLLSARGRRALLAGALVALTAAFVAGRPAAGATPDGDVVVTRKADYVHVLWDAGAAAAGTKAADRGALLGAAARLAASRLKANDPDEVRIDVVVVKEKDGYGKPKWDSLTRVARLTARLTRLSTWAAAHPAPAAADASLFEKVEWR
ncbi:MAG: hypothetical protein U0529_02835 [Thermoanaerobaculia bacterium]